MIHFIKKNDDMIGESVKGSVTLSVKISRTSHHDPIF
jgi:hypothetical protein